MLSRVWTVRDLRTVRVGSEDAAVHPADDWRRAQQNLKEVPSQSTCGPPRGVGKSSPNR